MRSRPKKLYRYSEKKWIEASLYEGSFKINSASLIKSLESDRGRQDEETKIEYEIPKNKTKIVNITKNSVIQPMSDVHFKSELSTDYYLLSLATAQKSYLFEEFKGSNACLIIHDTEEFSNRLLRTCQNIWPDWADFDTHIIYGSESLFGPSFSKPIEYIQQHEWRYSWIPPNGQSNLPHVIISIGNIEDIAEMVTKP